MAISCTFFVERLPTQSGDRGEDFLNLLEESAVPGGNRKVAARLLDEGWSIALALGPTDLTDSMARTIEYLNQLGTPVTAWVTLPIKQGYWTSAGNVVKTTDAAEAIQQWADREGILFRRFGFDFEIPIQLMRAFFSKDRRALVSELWRYLKAFGERKWANGYFRKYIETLHADEVETEFYVFPRILRVLLGGGMTPLPGWRMVEMLYTSAMSRKLGGWITRHRDRSAIPALGIVSGVEGMTPGMDLGGGDLPHHLTTEELAGDISALWAAPSLNEVYLFALNGSKVLELLGNAIDRTIRCQLRA